MLSDPPLLRVLGNFKRVDRQTQLNSRFLLPLSGLALIVLALLHPVARASAAFPSDLFGYKQSLQSDTAIFGQWVQALERHILIDLPEDDCNSKKLNRCHLRNWLAFLKSLERLSPDKQLNEVNRYANGKPYVLDIDNYGIEDYWAVPKEFLYNNGDCEDYAITKMFSLLWLGFTPDKLRIVVLQDTNLRIPHAVLAVANHDDVLILDNQLEEVISHRKIVHYAPVYSINEANWWIHLNN